MLGTVERWRFGWCGALPVAHGAIQRTLLFVTTVAIVTSLAFVTALLLGMSRLAPHRGDLAYALAGIDLAVVVGTLFAVLRVSRPAAVARARHEDSIREPLLALPWLNDPRLPHLLDWQRRASLIKWRRGGGAALVAAALFAIPDGATIASGVGLVLFVIGLAWLAVVMSSCVEVTADAVGLLRQMPFGDVRTRQTALRYPLLAVLCAMVLTGAGAALSGGGVVAVAAGCACACVIAVWPLRRLAATTRRKGLWA
ncbi:MAG: hypothetical protein ACREPH_14615 [Rhodanobacteraceae bacterium]